MGTNDMQSRARKLSLGAAGTLLTSAAAVATPAMAGKPPASGHDLISFPQHDFCPRAGPRGACRCTCASSAAAESSRRRLRSSPSPASCGCTQTPNIQPR